MSHWWGGNPNGVEEPDPPEHMATQAEADREYVSNVGPTRPEQAWILSDRDVWYPNPAYHGPRVPHPESYEAEFGDGVLPEPQDAAGDAVPDSVDGSGFSTGLDDIPF